MSHLRNAPTWLLALVVPVIAAIAVIVTLTTTSDNSVAIAPDTIVIKDFIFKPEPLQVKAGITVTVANGDDTRHTVTADDQAFDTGDINGGGTGTITIDKPGKYTYHCDIHNYMTGVIEAT
jgi:plastocyanin